MDKLRSDLVHALRSLRAHPGAATAVMCVLALGIGLTSAMFALADPYLLRPLPYARPHELVTIDLRIEDVDTDDVLPTLADWQARDDLFQSLAAYRAGPDLRIRTSDRAVALSTVEVTENFLDVLGVATPGGSQALATNAVDRSIAVVGEPTWLSGREHQTRTFQRQDGGAVHVTFALPSGFLFPRARATRIGALVFGRPTVLVEIERGPNGAFTSRAYTLIARLRAGVSAQAAQQSLRASLSSSRRITIDVGDLTASMRGAMRPLALGAFSAGFFILLICAANVGNLLLARGVYRTREWATREAIGAQPGDLARLVLVDLSILTVGGIAIGLAIAWAALAVAREVIPVEYATLGEPRVTGRVIAFGWLSGAIVMLAGVVPAGAAWRLARRTLVGSSAASDTAGVRTLRHIIAATQCALAAILMSGAALLLRSYVNVLSQETGFAPNVVLVSASYPASYAGPLLQADIDATIARLRRLPGVAAAGAAIGPMVDEVFVLQMARVNGRTAPVDRKHISIQYFDAVGTPLIDGRHLTHDDLRTGIIVNESFARLHWPGAHAVGQQIVLGARPATIVGVVRDAFDVALDAPPRPMIFSLLDNLPFTFRVTYAVRLTTARAPSAFDREIAAVNAEAVVVDASPLGARLRGTVKDRMFATLVLTFFAVAGLGVCAAGLLGVVSFIVARRTREIAIRMALGATPWRIRRLILHDALAAASFGTIAGLVAGRWLSRTLNSLLYGVEPGDLPALVAVSALLILAAGIASAVPLRKAVRLSPSQAMRAE